MVATALRWPLVSIAFDGRVALPIFGREATSLAGDTSELRTTMLTASVGPCLHASMVFVCIPFELGVRSFSSTNRVRVNESEPFATMFGFRAGAEWNFSRRFAFRAYVYATGTPQPTIVMAEGREVWRAPLVSGVLSAAIVHTP